MVYRMNYCELEQELLEFSEAEKIYKELYLQNSVVYEETVKDWSDFILRYCKCFTSDIDIPLTAPSFIGRELLEKDWFPQNEIEIFSFKNARYCPAFLHSLEFIKLIYVLRGQCVLHVENKKIKIQHGGFCLVSPNIEQTIFSCNDEDIVINVIMRRSTFSTAFFSLLTEQGIISDFFWQMLYSKNSNKILLFSCESDPVLDRTILDLYNEASYQNKPSNLLLKSFVMIFFAYVLRNHQSDVVPLGKISGTNNTLPMIILYIKENFKYVTLMTLAEHFHMSEGYISRYIRRNTGYTFSYLLRELRMREAAEMLRNTTCNIEEIIDAVGYTDTSHFYHNFKNIYGMTPAMYRKREDIYIIE